jgi:hypothetical protein
MFILCITSTIGTRWALFRGHSIDASYQVSIYLAKRFQKRRFFRNQPIRSKNCLWRPCLLTHQEASLEGPLYRWLIYFRFVSKHGRHRQFLFLIGWFLKNILLCNHLAKWIRGPSKDASYQGSIYLAKGFQGRRFFRNQPIRKKNFLWI